jgi:diguanylate cyclase (GGDEF)-like protein
VRVLLAAVVAYLAARLHLLGRRAALDPKTGLLTTTAWLHAATRRLRRREPPGVAVLMLDIDRFKQVNDARGHLAGDAVIASVARTVRTHLRADDLAARFGGDEFVAIVCGVGESQARSIAERVRAAVRGSCSVTVSVGVALRPASAVTDLRALLVAADAALYSAKRGGGDAVVLAGGAPPSAAERVDA